MNKRFNDIEELAKDWLVELLDKELELVFKPLTGYMMIKLINKRLTWSELKETYLFFIQIMLNDYKLAVRKPFTIYGNEYIDDWNYHKDCTLEMLSELDDDLTCATITVYLG